MRWVTLLVWLMASPAQAQWAAFTPCGFASVEDEAMGFETFTGAAEQLRVYHVWVPAVMGVAGFTEQAIGDGTVCAVVLLPGKRIYVLGSAEEVLKKLQNE